MFGRTCRTHLSLLKELWVGETQLAEDKTVHQYVLDLHDKIQSTHVRIHVSWLKWKRRKHKEETRNILIRRPS